MISKEIALDRSAWRLAINVPELWTYFFRVSSLAYPNLLGKKGYVVVFVGLFLFFAETDTCTWVGHQHPHPCLCNTGQDCSIAILLDTPPLGTQQLLVNTIWQSTKEQKTKGPGLQRTWLASLHKSRFPDAVSTHICCDLCANQLCWANSGSVHFFTIQFCSIFS